MSVLFDLFFLVDLFFLIDFLHEAALSMFVLLLVLYYVPIQKPYLQRYSIAFRFLILLPSLIWFVKCCEIRPALFF